MRYHQPRTALWLAATRMRSAGGIPISGHAACSRTARRGVVLLVVMAMLALFATVGLSFVFYAENEAAGAMFRRQAEIANPGDIHPERIFNFALGQILFDTDNTGSSLRGHSLGRSIYGSFGGTVPYNGLGRDRTTVTELTAALTPLESINVPYTYPDINNPWLASIDSSGKIKDRSFYRGGKTLRPPGLPPVPASGEGDVKNVECATDAGNNITNDAFWIDPGFPMMITKDGTKFKPLIAVTMLDLDGRLNLATAGNYGANYTAGNQITSRFGIGPWEINPARVLTAAPGEIPNLFRGKSTMPTRLGTSPKDGADKTITLPGTRFYSRIDYSGLSSDKMNSPTALFTMFPSFGAWADVNNAVHPAGFDYFAAPNLGYTAVDARLAASNTEALLRWRERGGASLTSDPFRQLPTNIDPSGNPNLLHLLTTYSMSLDTAHLAPFSDPVGNPAAKYQLNDGATYPKQTMTTQLVPAGTSGEFSSVQRSLTAGDLRRVNLNTTLTSYSANPAGAANERRLAAKLLFERLVRVTGAKATFAATQQNDPEWKATRWLAQLAVNMVDFIDEDDALTTFNWNEKADPNALEAHDYVCGIEINRLCINEAYASYDNDKNDPGLADLAKASATKYRLNVWAELYNPLKADASLSERDNGLARLNQANRAVYRLILAKNDDGISQSPTGDASNVISVCDDWPPNDQVSQGDSQFASGFYLVGPTDTFLNDRKPSWGVALHHTTATMSKEYDLPLPNAGNDPLPTLVLQRLADPNRNGDSDPKSPNYNPYVTVDYFKNIRRHDSLKFKENDANPRGIGNVGTFQSTIRKQPLKATDTTFHSLPGHDPDNGDKAKPQHSMGRQNTNKNPPNGDFAPLETPFKWIVHLDRPLISTGELVHVRHLHPHEVTQKYPGEYHVITAFGDKDALLYRFLETVTVGSRMHNARIDTAGSVLGANRKFSVVTPGKLNLNTLMDKKILAALLDPQMDTSASPATPKFSLKDPTHVDDFWNDLVAARPIAGFSDFAYSETGGVKTVTIKNTLFQNNKLFAKIFSTASGATDYDKTEGLIKTMNNITFTSNAFAVWVTVGFFEYNDSTLAFGKEIGKDELRHIRHRMFAIVDRSQLVLPDERMTKLMAGVTKGNARSVQLEKASDTMSIPNGTVKTPKVTFNWTLRPGMRLLIDKGAATEEGVEILAATGATITANFKFDHNANATVHIDGIRNEQSPFPGTVLGYPGPQPEFNLRDYNYVVPYFTIID